MKRFSFTCRSQFEGGKKAKKAPVMFDLSTDKGTQGFRKAVQEADEEGDSPFDRIEVTWPLPMLEVRVPSDWFSKQNNRHSLPCTAY